MRSGVKSCTQRVLQRMGLYYRLKESRLYDAYWRLADRQIIDTKLAEAAFYSACLEGFRRGQLVFDIGANEGYKTDVFLRMGARVVAVDPDPHNQKALRQSFLTNRLFKKPVVVVGKAVGDKQGTETMWIDGPGSGKNSLSRKWVDILRTDDQRFGTRLTFSTHRIVETVSLESLIATYGMPFFIKIDVEGYEPEVVRGLQRPVPYLSFEVNLPEFRQEGEECIELLGSLAPEGRFNYVVDCQLGFVLAQWLKKLEFLPRFRECADSSIEVFWRGSG